MIDTSLEGISLFSGVGGFEIGFQRAGIRTLLQAERDPWCLGVLERHFPAVERLTDVRDVHARGRAGDRLVVYGGFPCQDLSGAGLHAGLRGERSGEWFEFHRVLRELRPRWAIIENVPGLLSSNSGADFAVILAGLDELGFDAAWAILDAQYFGVPQRRRRVFIVAGPRGDGPQQVLSICESCGGSTAASGAARQTAAPPRGAGGGRGGGVIASAITASAGHHGHSSPRGDGSDNLVASTIDTDPARHIGRGDGTENLVAAEEGVRRLMPIEHERLQGWPDDWTRWTADGREVPEAQRYHMTGNGVASPVAEWIAHRLVAVDSMLPLTALPASSLL